MNHSNWLRNSILSEIVNGNIPIFVWDTRTRIVFKDLPVFEQQMLNFSTISLFYQLRNYPQGLHMDTLLVSMANRLCIVPTFSTERVSYSNAPTISTRTLRTTYPAFIHLLAEYQDKSVVEHTKVRNNGDLNDLLTQAIPVYRTSLTQIHPQVLDYRKRSDPSLILSFQGAIRN